MENSGCSSAQTMVGLTFGAESRQTTRDGGHGYAGGDAAKICENHQHSLPLHPDVTRLAFKHLKWGTVGQACARRGIMSVLEGTLAT